MVFRTPNLLFIHEPMKTEEKEVCLLILNQAPPHVPLITLRGVCYRTLSAIVCRESKESLQKLRAKEKQCNNLVYTECRSTSEATLIDHSTWNSKESILQQHLILQHGDTLKQAVQYEEQ